MEAALRWSPSSTADQKQFLVVDVAGNSLTLYGAESVNKSDIRYKQLAYRDKVPNFTAFDWSRSDPSLVALGLSSGDACVLRIEPGRKNLGTLHDFSIRTQRKCNSITFNSDNLVAIGLDRVRHDHCLNIYDLENDQEPYRRLCTSEAVSSVKFFPSQPQELVAAVSRTTLRLYDLRDPSFSTTGSGSSGITKHVNNVSIDPLDQNYFASGGSTGDPSVSIWDKRWFSRPNSSSSSATSAESGAVLELRPAVDNSLTTSVWSIRYSGAKRGRFSVLSSTGEVKLYDTARFQDHSKGRITSGTPVNFYGGNPWSSSYYVAKTHNLQYSCHDEVRGLNHDSRAIAFDWMDAAEGENQSMIVLRPSREVDVLHVPNPHHINITGRDELAIGGDEIAVFQPKAEGPSVAKEISAIRDQQLHASWPNDLPNDHASENANGKKQLAEEHVRSIQGSKAAAATRTAQWLQEDFGDGQAVLHSKNVSNALTEISVQRRRCQEGYLFVCMKNAQIVADDWPLVTLWNTIKHFEDFTLGDLMVSESLDLSYLGIEDLWNSQQELGSSRVTSQRSMMPARMQDSIAGVVKEHKLPPFSGVQTEKPAERVLCLALCCWAFSRQDAERQSEALLLGKAYHKAIALCFFQGHRDLAIMILRELIRSHQMPNDGLIALLASDSLNADQRDMCVWMAEETTDPYLRALLYHLHTEDWSTLINNTALDLSNRVGLALVHLSDTNLTHFLRSATQSGITTGDPTAVLLTGLGESAMDLFQSYLTRTGDLQTAVLATARTNPKYVHDVRWEMWKETYFTTMQAWRAFIPRTRFVALHARMCVSREGKSLVAKPPPQIKLRCAHCAGDVARQPPEGEVGHPGRGVAKGGPAAMGPGVDETGRLKKLNGTVCPKCGRHLPRCSVCMLWLGTPDPSAKDVKGEVGGKPGSAGAAGGGGEEKDVLARFVTFCVQCGHGFHAHHAKTWFKKHGMCPVPDCRCLCGLRG